MTDEPLLLPQQEALLGAASQDSSPSTPGRATHVYVGIKRECGCQVAGVCDDADKNTAKAVADFIKSGLRVERVTVAEAGVVLRRCPHGPPQKKPGRQLEMLA